MTRKILIAALVVALAGGFIGYRMYNEKTPTASELDADVTMDARSLFAAFVQNDTAAGDLYNQKVVQVGGVIGKIETGAKTNVHLESGDPSGAVVCEFDSAFTVGWSVGQTVSIKGICAGFNGLPGMGDVLLQRCAAVE